MKPINVLVLEAKMLCIFLIFSGQNKWLSPEDRFQDCYKNSFFIYFWKNFVNLCCTFSVLNIFFLWKVTKQLRHSADTKMLRPNLVRYLYLQL